MIVLFIWGYWKLCLKHIDKEFIDGTRLKNVGYALLIGKHPFPYTTDNSKHFWNTIQHVYKIKPFSQVNKKKHFSGDVALTIVKQPEQQHRARYQTEGSRGAVKDREGNGFPVVQLTGYYKPAMLQVDFETLYKFLLK